MLGDVAAPNRRQTITWTNMSSFIMPYGVTRKWIIPLRAASPVNGLVPNFVINVSSPNGIVFSRY